MAMEYAAAEARHAVPAPGFHFKLINEPGFNDRASDTGLGQLSACAVDLRQAQTERDIALLEARQANEARARFMQEAPRQFRTPVRALLKLARAMEVDPPRGQATGITTMRRLAEHLLALVETVTEAAESPENEASYISNEALGALLDRLGKASASAAAQKGLNFRILHQGHAPGAVWPVDGTRLGALLETLLDNAVRYTACGEVSLGLELTDTHASIHVIDTGHGARNADFAPLLPDEAWVEDIGISRGVGLIRARALADQLGCTIRVASTSAQGTHLSVDLPGARSATDSTSSAADGTFKANAHMARLNETMRSLARAHAEANNALQQAHIDGLMRLVAAAELKDDDTGAHIVRMGFFSAIIARSYGMDSGYCNALLHASRMHDVGKIGIPDNILQKQGRLTPDEWEIMRRHPEIGATLLRGANNPLYDMAAEIALSHHEKFDGSGYPNGLRGADIPLAARIVALADFFDAVTMHRCYRAAMNDDTAFTLILEGSGKHFDPAVVDAFFRALPALLQARSQINTGHPVTL